MFHFLLVRKLWQKFCLEENGAELLVVDEVHSNIKAKVHHIAVPYHIFLPLQPQLARFL